MRSSSMLLLAALVLGAAADTADAGLKQSWPVAIDTVNRTASGSLGTARNDKSDASQYIGCSTWASGLSTSTGGDAQTFVGCSARNKNASVLCGVTSSAVGATNMGLLFGMNTSDGLISFSWDASGRCTDIQLWAYASLAPKKLVP